jgi:transcriptional regulator of acetoin/glycerol metabolism
MHLAAQSARGIENAMVEALPYALIVRVNWPGMSLADVDDGLVALNTDGCVLGFNQAAAKIVSVKAETGHANDVFAMPFERLFDAAQNGKPCLNVPLWSGLRVNAAPLLKGHSVPRYAFVPQMPLRDAANNLIQQAIRETKGDVSEAARKLGISRATLYRKLAPPSKRHYP